MDMVKNYTPFNLVPRIRVLLIGPVGVGKSSFFNSVNSVFRGHVTSQAIAGSASSSLTTKFRAYSIRDGREGKPLPVMLCDTMGLEEHTGTGIDTEDIVYILKGHVPENYQFNPSVSFNSDTLGYIKNPSLKDQIHCVAFVMDACKISILSPKLEEKLCAIRSKINMLGVPQIVLLTKVDEACPLVAENTENIYRSRYIESKIHAVGARLGIPVSCVMPVKNYSSEVDLEKSIDILLLAAIIQMQRFADNYLDNFCIYDEKFD
ncbi:interferon-induced protein 44-like isoform X2 [Protopterus annectens]|nr:interferon-induced protein 44-like isoform X2 [Protopterus annectens]XP_043941654.1 interferon-induced protein 44-like isoform X2 [Protopterus annectens]